MITPLRTFLICLLVATMTCVATAQDQHLRPAKQGKLRLATDLSPRYYPYKDRETYPQRLLAKLNDIRKAHQLAPLAYSPVLGEVAQAHSTDMYIRNFVDHVNPDGEDHSGRLARLKPRLLVLQAKENLAWYEATFLIPEQDLIDKEFKGLMQSPPHRAAILSDDVRQVGFGFTTFWNNDRFESNQVQLFGDIAGEWRTDVPKAIHPNQTFELVLSRPIDVFLASETNPRGQFRDPIIANKMWIGGSPIYFQSKAKVPTLQIPNVPPGDYRIQCSPKGENRYVMYKKVKVDRSN